MSGAKQLQIMNNLREPGIVTGCTGQGVTRSRGLGFTINGWCRRSLLIKNRTIMNGCCLLSLVCSSFVTCICHFRLPTMLVTTFGVQILRKNPGCLFRGQSCCVLIENDLLHCWIVCEPELMQSDTSEQAVGGHWSRDVADLSSERISSKDNKNNEGVTESNSWRGGGPESNPLWQLLCCKVWLC